jgi:hypothetical protein
MPGEAQDKSGGGVEYLPVERRNPHEESAG